MGETCQLSTIMKYSTNTRWTRCLAIGRGTTYMYTHKRRHLKDPVGGVVHISVTYKQFVPYTPPTHLELTDTAVLVA